MQTKEEINAALTLLGELLVRVGASADLLVVGGGALLLHGIIERSTLDLDAIARVCEGTLQAAEPLPEELIAAVHEVATALGLPSTTKGDEKDWLNAGPSMLMDTSLPEGFGTEALELHFGTLTIRVASRSDLVCLKLWASTSPQRSRRDIDLSDLRALKPSLHEMRRAVAWCMTLDGRTDFFTLDLKPLLIDLGFEPEEFSDA